MKARGMDAISRSVSAENLGAWLEADGVACSEQSSRWPPDINSYPAPPADRNPDWGPRSCGGSNVHHEEIVLGLMMPCMASAAGVQQIPTVQNGSPDERDVELLKRSPDLELGTGQSTVWRVAEG
ncbi:hypothetical protein NDU88_002011 [Pleurodeles waltl]|uniref:Uncharacterized protein n=1 Tax=Pleurodeles waltl TaxID=8319 RepID=A0AAV7S976_PLEWA|nr:hypothetical protein NDU88_002011 [Pleurodeles waltl]